MKYCMGRREKRKGIDKIEGRREGERYRREERREKVGCKGKMRGTQN